MNRDTIVVGASGASGMPLLIQCLKLIRAAGRSSVLIMSDSAVLTLRQETGSTPDDLAPLVDAVYGPCEVGAPPASGSWPASRSWTWGRHSTTTLTRWVVRHPVTVVRCEGRRSSRAGRAG